MSCTRIFLHGIIVLLLGLLSPGYSLKNSLRTLRHLYKVPKHYPLLLANTSEMSWIVLNSTALERIIVNHNENGSFSGMYSTDCMPLPDSVRRNDSDNLTEIMCLNTSGRISVNLSNTKYEPPAHYSTLFASVAATLSAVIFVFGILGNILVVVVIVRTRSMHTTTNCYLLSLALADSLVLLTATLPAIPEPFYRVDEWPYGRVMCSLLIFLQYLGVDISSLSITAFTIERYIAICHPMKAQTMCTVRRAKRIIAILWIFTFLYCSPWLGLTYTVEIDIPNEPPVLKCSKRLARSSYLVTYMIDLILFYVIPLIIATVLYLLIGRILYLSRALRKSEPPSARHSPKGSVVRRTDSRVQVVRMLVVVVVAFASLWMPYRVMVVYNSFAYHKYLDLWFLLFARTMVYVNCAINPVLYNIMSVKFKRAFRNHLSCWHRRFSIPSHHYSEVPTDIWATKRITFGQNQPFLKQQHAAVNDAARVKDRQNCIFHHSQNCQARIEKQQSDLANSNANSTACSSSHSGSTSVAEQTV